MRQFARAAGILAKSDIIDAAVLVRFGAAMQPASTSAQPAYIARLRELDEKRRHLSRLLEGRTKSARPIILRRAAGLESQLD